MAGVLLALRWADSQVLVHVDVLVADVKSPDVIEALLRIEYSQDEGLFAALWDHRAVAISSMRARRHLYGRLAEGHDAFSSLRRAA